MELADTGDQVMEPAQQVVCRMAERHWKQLPLQLASCRGGQWRTKHYRWIEGTTHKYMNACM
eukprot:1157312-Pelagomonas_calceolata.AAC.6